MLSEEMILVIASLAAAALLIVALLEVVWPSHGRHRRARGRYTSPRARGPRAAERRPVAPPRQPLSRPGPAPVTRVLEQSPVAPLPAPVPVKARQQPIVAPSPAPLPARTPAPAPPAPVPPAAPIPPAPVVAVTPPAVPAAGPARVETPAPTGEVLPFEECFALYQDKRYADVIAAAMPALDRYVETPSAGARLAHEMAALWSLVGLSKQALTDEEGARAAFEEAIHAAPASERSTYQRHLAALALTVGRKLMARAETLPETVGEERIAALRGAGLWLRQGLACAPDDTNLTAALERSRKGLWVSYGQVATALIQRQEFHGARRLIREALAEEGFPDDRREAFKDLLTTTFSGEIGQLTAHAIRTMQDEHEREALAALQKAEALLSSIPEEALTPKRREEVSRRLWWGYTKLGVRRVESGEFEDAVEPLFHALKFGEIDVERQQETRTVLVRALEGVTEARAESIDQLLKTGKREAAIQEGDRLRTLLRQSMEVGLTKADLTAALTRTRHVLEQVESS
jgi:tetratricopeptide (TPR) repeat protein